MDPIATGLGLPVDLVLAVIQVESGGETAAVRYEPPYRYLWDVRRNKPFRKLTAVENTRDSAPSDFPAPVGVSTHTEWICQQASWGLMQVMGAVARERGLRLPFLSSLIEPCTGVEYGCMHLAWLAGRYLKSHGWAGVLRGYNGGPYAVIHNTNPEYPQKVAAALGGKLPEVSL